MSGKELDIAKIDNPKLLLCWKTTKAHVAFRIFRAKVIESFADFKNIFVKIHSFKHKYKKASEQIEEKRLNTTESSKRLDNEISLYNSEKIDKETCYEMHRANLIVKAINTDKILPELKTHNKKLESELSNIENSIISAGSERYLTKSLLNLEREKFLKNEKVAKEEIQKASSEYEKVLKQKQVLSYKKAEFDEKLSKLEKDLKFAEAQLTKTKDCLNSQIIIKEFLQEECSDLENKILSVKRKEGLELEKQEKILEKVQEITQKDEEINQYREKIISQIESAKLHRQQLSSSVPHPSTLPRAPRVLNLSLYESKDEHNKLDFEILALKNQLHSIESDRKRLQSTLFDLYKSSPTLQCSSSQFSSFSS